MRKREYGGGNYTLRDRNINTIIAVLLHGIYKNASL